MQRCHAHLEAQYKHQVQYHIDDAGHGKEIQGPAGVALGTEDGCAKVIEHIGGHTAEINAQVQGGQVNDVGRGGHPYQHLPAERYPTIISSTPLSNARVMEV